ncbi:MAG: imidazole glycerol phosphate synthase subunit HisF [Moraxellaceae bacterium]|nr:MAG: imidazole glycerol phosphate synthase subunit HisF [Moraxellaceae bacterium]
MLRTRIIPVILIDGFSVIKTCQFGVRRNLGNPIQVVRTYNTRNVDELIILDIDAHKQNRTIDLWTIRDITQDCFMPLTIGGGIKSLEDIRQTLLAGADKICINTQAILQPDLITQAAEQFGRQCIVVSVDVLWHEERAYVHNTHVPVRQLLVSDWLEQVQDLGAGEILITGVVAEGTMQGPDLSLLELIKNKVNIPYIYNGGIKQTSDCVDVIEQGAHAVAASSIFHFTSITPEECKQAMDRAGIAVRLF